MSVVLTWRCFINVVPLISRENCISVPYKEIERRPTRDILHVTGQVASGDTLDVFVCHMPSRAGGEEKSEPYRLFTAQILKIAADSVMNIRQHPNVMIMGDFNDYPTNNSIAKVLGAVAPKSGVQAKKLYNLMDGRKEGTYRYRGEWGVLDQLIVSGFLLQGHDSMRTSYDKAQILKYPFLLEEDENMVVIFHHVPIGERNIMVVIATICQCVWTLKLENRERLVVSDEWTALLCRRC